MGRDKWRRPEIRIVTIVGARPQFIKAAPVSRAFQEHNRHTPTAQITEIIIHTGQHYDYDMSQVFFEELGLFRPHYDLGVGSGTHGEMTGALLPKIEAILLEEKPHLVLLYGDTNSTLAGALAASKLHILVAHVEAGLRSYNRRMPEEVNRVLTDHVSSILFCPTNTAVRNLAKEGITEGVFKVGDVMYDAFLLSKALADKKSTILFDLRLAPRSYCLATVHRQENTDDIQRLDSIFQAFHEIGNHDCPIIVPLHPRTRKALQRLKLGPQFSQHVTLISPVSYLDMLTLESNARMILTDSGGMQKEAYFAQVPCVTLREETEWTETIESGWNHLGGTECQQIVSVFKKAANSHPLNHTRFYGDGAASLLILSRLLSNVS